MVSSLSDNSLRPFAAAGLVLLAILGLAGCAADAQSLGGLPDSWGASSPKANSALENLARRDLEKANQLYAEIADSGRRPSVGSAGLALTDTLLLPGSKPVDTWIAEDLGGNFGSGDVLDAQYALYKDGGYLYWVSRGARWESRSTSSGVEGIKDLIADRLPWSQARLESLRTFTDGFDSPANTSIPDLLALAEHIRQIESDIDQTLGSDFKTLIVPGETFHDTTMTMTIGQSELAVLGAGLAFLRGSIRYLAAYRWEWTLQHAFKDYPDEMIAERGDDWTHWDLSLEFLSQRMLRGISDDRRRHLTDARDAWTRSLRYLERAIDLGLDSSTETLLRWERVDSEYTRNLQEFLGALRQSLTGRTTLPFTEPETSANLALLFDPGRSLPESTDWLENYLVDAPETDDGEKLAWRLRDEAIQTFLVTEIFQPHFDVTTEGGPELTIAGDRLNTFFDNLAGELEADFQEAYLAQ